MGGLCVYGGGGGGSCRQQLCWEIHALKGGLNQGRGRSWKKKHSLKIGSCKLCILYVMQIRLLAERAVPGKDLLE